MPLTTGGVPRKSSEPMGGTRHLVNMSTCPSDTGQNEPAQPSNSKLPPTLLLIGPGLAVPRAVCLHSTPQYQRVGKEPGLVCCLQFTSGPGLLGLRALAGSDFSSRPGGLHELQGAHRGERKEWASPLLHEPTGVGGHSSGS